MGFACDIIEKTEEELKFNIAALLSSNQLSTWSETSTFIAQAAWKVADNHCKEFKEALDQLQDQAHGRRQGRSQTVTSLVKLVGDKQQTL